MIWLRVDKQAKTPMTRQLYVHIRKAILSGRLEAGTKLISSRELAQQLKISRNVIVDAYELLHAEGYVETIRGAGTFVAQGATLSLQAAVSAPDVRNITMGHETEKGVINFRAGTPDLSLFPQESWKQIIKKILNKPLEDSLAYGHPEGRAELRKAICTYVVSQREVSCHPDQIVITAGTTQAIGIVSSLLVSAHRNTVVVEDPLTYDIKEISKQQGAEICTVPVDDNGMQTQLLPADINPVCVYTTPSHQFPMGGTLPIQRRIELLEYAEQKNCYIIEDDYDSEFRFDGPPISSLHGLCPSRVIYIGTFSKTLCPALRVGYIIFPHELISRGRNRKWHCDLHNEVLSQLTLAGFIENGGYLKHVNRMRKHYMRRRKVLVQTLRSHFRSSVKILGSETGLHLVARFEGYTFAAQLFNDLEKQGVKLYDILVHCVDPDQHRDKLLIGYGNVTESEIQRGIGVLARAVQS